MAQPLTVPLPPNIDLWDSCVIRVTALNPTTGAVVPGVEVSDVNIEVEQTQGPPIDIGNPLLIGIGI